MAKPYNRQDPQRYNGNRKGRKRLGDPTAEKCLCLPLSLAAHVEYHLRVNSGQRRVPYGAFGNLVTQLLRRWLAEGTPEVPIARWRGPLSPSPVRVPGPYHRSTDHG